MNSKNEDGNDGGEPSVYDQHNHNNFEDTVKAKTRSYHRKLLDIAASPANKSSLAWDCTQYVLDQVWEGGGNGSTDIGKRQNNNNNNTIIVDESRRIVYACQVCGHLIHPGFQGTSLRVERRNNSALSSSKSKKTIRRRQQRRKKKQLLSKLRNAKDSNRPKHKQQSSADNINTNNEPSLDESVSIVLLDDDQNLILDRHHLAIRCGRCQSKVRLKGLKREKSKAVIEQQTTSDTLTKQGFSKHQNYFKKSSEVAPHWKHQTSVDDEDPNEFMKLPPSSTAAAAAAKSTTNISLLPTQGRKKKKKKKQDTSKGNKLMSFLNSLND